MRARVATIPRMGFFRKTRIFADAAAGTPLRKEVEARLLELLPLYGNPGSIHREGVQARETMDAIRKEAAEAIRAHPREIVFTSGGTESNNLALLGTVRSLGRKVHLITTAVEHPSILECVRMLEHKGHRATYLPVDRDGLVSPKALREAIRGDTSLVSVQYVNSETGVVQDLRELAKTVRHMRKERKGDMPLLFHTDASQAPLYLSCDMQKLGVDLMTLDAQKMMGGRGAGVLCVKNGAVLSPLIVGGGQERGLRSGTENVALNGACARALSLAQQEYETNAERVGSIRDALWTHLRKLLPDAEQNGSTEARIASVLNVWVPELEAELATLGLDARGIAASSRSACSMEEGGPSSVIQVMGFSPERAAQSIRFSFLPTVGAWDAQRVAEALREVRATLPYRRS